MSTLKTKIILLKELLALKEVVDKGSIQIAAGENGIKNSNLSQMIKNLEHRFHTKLINRGANGSLPTNSTQLIYNDICAVEEIINKILENFIDLDALSGSMSVWTEEGLFGSFILKDLSEFYAKYPKIRLELLMRKEPDISSMDILIIKPKLHPNIHGTVLFKFKTHLKFYTSKKYLSKHGAPKNINDLLENHKLCMVIRYMNLPEYQSIIKRAKHLNTTSDSLALIYRLVNDGDGITVFPSWFEESSPNLVCIKDLDFEYEMETQCICRTEIAESPKVSAFVNFFIDFCKGHNVPIDIYF
ncbi:MAG: LysR family transcriptional regulator [Alphaproteobacteria bacterium]|nr:LysR family transcriptional regulator [Alphaproteobacteria bacterium]